MPTVRLVRPQYTISFSIGDIDLTMRLNTVTIINSIKTIYPIFLLKLNISSKDYFLEKIYGQNDAKLQIVLTSESSIPLETTNIELIIIHNSNKVSSQIPEGVKESNQLEDEMYIVAIHKPAFLTMSSTVNLISNSKINNNISSQNINNVFNSLIDNNFSNNSITDPLIDVFEIIFGPRENWNKNIKPISVSSNILPGDDPLNDVIRDFSNNGIDDFLNFLEVNTRNPVIAKPILDLLNNIRNNNNNGTSLNGEYSPISIVEKILQKYINNVNVNIKRTNTNNIQIPDVVIPPISFISAIRYLNDRYGIYKGPLHVYYNMEDTFNMWDISTISSSSEIDYTVELLARGLNDTETFKNSISNDNYFYTYQDIKVQNKTNNALMNKGYEHIIVKNPRNKFSEIVKTTIENILETVSISDNPELIFNESIKKQRRVHSIGVTGTSEDEDNAFMTSKLSQYIASSSMFRYYLKGTKLPLKKITRVGGPMKFLPRISEYLKFSGKYIVGSSVITLTRESTGSYMCYMEGTAFRESIET